MRTMTLTDVVTLILTALAVARLTRLVNRDVLLERPRAAVLTWLTDRDRTMLAYLVVCPWCLSMYLGAGAAAAWWAWSGHNLYVCINAALAFSYLTGVLASKESE